MITLSGARRVILSIVCCVASALCGFAAESSATSAKAASPEAPAAGDCEKLGKNDWTPAELRAWKAICAGDAIDFNREYNQTLAPFDAAQWRDPGRRLIRGAFLQTVLTGPKFAGKVIAIRGAYFPETTEIDNLTASGLTIADSRFARTFKVKYGEYKLLSFHKNFVGHWAIFQFIQASDLDITENQIADTLVLWNARSDSLECCGEAARIDIRSTKIDGIARLTSSRTASLTFSDSAAATLRIYPYWTPNAALDLSNSTIDHIVMFADSGFPQRINAENLTARQWSIVGGSNTVIPFLPLLTSRIDQKSKIDVMQKLTEEYRREGDFNASDELVRLKGTEELHQAKELNWVLGKLSSLFGFGTQLQYAFALIAVLVMLGYFIFRNDGRHVKSNSKPRSWFIFAVDAVIPGINLDEAHKNIEFKDWKRQYYLYLLKALGVLLVFLVLKYLSQSAFLGA
jgi:hypothetical protein